MCKVEERWAEAAISLWDLLDDIDTLDDACKGNDGLFRKQCYELQRKRFKILAPTTCGEHQTLYFPEESA